MKAKYERVMKDVHFQGMYMEDEKMPQFNFEYMLSNCAAKCSFNLGRLFFRVGVNKSFPTLNASGVKKMSFT